MPTPAILNQVAGYMAKVEAAYGTAETLTAGSDGIYPYLGDGLPSPPTALEYLFDGNIGRDVSTLFPARRVAPNGRGRKQDFPVLFKGAGTSYSGSIKPPREVDLLLQAAGFDGTFSTKWDYTPTAAGTGYKSLTVGTYAQGKAQILAGALADWSFAFENLGVPTHTFALQGIGALPTTLSLPSVTYQYTSIIPPVASGATITMGSWVAPVVKSGKFALNRNIGNARARITAAGGHLGFVPGAMAPELTFTVEQSALVASPYHTSGGLDPDQLREAATAITVSAAFGSTTTNRWSVTLANAQLTAVTPSADDAVAMWDLTFRGTGATAVTVTFD